MTEPAKTPPAGLPEAGSDLPGTGRTEAFSDGVFAIVITLLVLDLTNPHYRPGGLGAALARQWPSYLAFGFSFVYVGVIWLNHHALFRRISRLDLGLNWINLGVLLGAVIIPFPTAVLAGAFAEGDDNDKQVAVLLYALAAALMSAAWLAAFSYLSRHPELLQPGTTPRYVRQQLGRPLHHAAPHRTGPGRGEARRAQHAVQVGQAQHVAQKASQRMGRRGARAARLPKLDGMRAIVRQFQFALQQTSVGMRVRAHPSVAFGSKGAKLGHQPAGSAVAS